MKNEPKEKAKKKKKEETRGAPKKKKMHRGAEEHTELVALIASAARCFRGDAHVVTIDEFGAIPTVVLAAASEVYRAELAFGNARTTLAMAAVRFPGTFVYDTEEGARWVCRFLTGSAEPIRDARLAVAVHDVIDYWGIDLVRARVEARIVDLVCHADAAAVWHYARDRLDGSARAMCAAALARTMFLAADVDALDGYDVRALVDEYEHRTLALFHGLARWLNTLNGPSGPSGHNGHNGHNGQSGQSKERDVGVGALGAIHYAAAECVASSFASTAGADMDAIEGHARAHIACLVLDILRRNVTGKRKRSAVEPQARRQDAVGCTAPDGIPPPVSVRADGTATIDGVEFAHTGVARCSAVHFARGAMYVLGPNGSAVLRFAGPVPTQVAMPPIDAAAAFEYGGEIHALDAASDTFVVFRDAAWRASGLPCIRGARRGGFSFAVFNRAIYAVSRTGSVLRLRRDFGGQEGRRNESGEGQEGRRNESGEDEERNESGEDEERNESEEWEREASVAPNAAPRVADGEIHFGP
ncbi:MAG: hypothetical protein EBZ77_01270 [Chitinophagia bacterium]|nr:hypothetical protein [Chitinophagia bacterium]